MDAQVLETGDLVLHDGLGQTELGDAVGQHAAAGEERLEHGDVEALAREGAGAGDAGRAGAHHGDLLAVLGLADGRLAHLVGHVAEHALELADGHGLALTAEDALALALVLLRAHAAADTREQVVVLDGGKRAAPVLGADLLDELRDMHAHGAAVHAEGLLAVQAAVGLGDGVGLGEAVVDRTKIASTLGRQLLVGGGARRARGTVLLRGGSRIGGRGVLYFL